MFSHKLFGPLWKSKQKKKHLLKKELTKESSLKTYWGAHRKISKRLCDFSFWKWNTWLHTENKAGKKTKISSSLSWRGMFILKTWLVSFNMSLITSGKWGALVQQPFQINLGFRPLPLTLFKTFKTYQCVWDSDVRKRTWELKYFSNKCGPSCRKLTFSHILPSRPKKLYFLTTST